MTLEEYEKLNPGCVLKAGEKSILFATPNVFTKRRVDTLFDKEPATIAWIASFAPDDILVDVGANVGMYTIWAAMTRDVRVFAFEPESQNFALLNRNIFLNRLGDRVKAFGIGLSDSGGYFDLYLSSCSIGGSGHSLGDSVDFNLAPRKSAFAQGCVAAKLDDLVSGGVIPAPQHIKIDIDGFEPKVLRGARKLLQGDVVKSVLVEVNESLEDHRKMLAQLDALGFHYDPRQVEQARRKCGPFKGVAEYVFRR